MDSLTEALKRLDVKASQVRQQMLNATKDQIREFWSHLDFSTIYHDWALEGQVVSLEELDTALNSRAVMDVNNIPQNSMILSHKEALDTARELATQKDLLYDSGLFFRFHRFFASEKEAAKGARYRQEIPLHRAYFHEISQPSRIEGSMAVLFDWLNDPEDLVNLHPLEWGCKFHYRFMHVFPFVETSGKVGRTLMNMFFVRHGLLPAVIHARERQRYYEAIRQSQNDLLMLLIESADSSMDAAQKFLRSAAMAS